MNPPLRHLQKLISSKMVLEVVTNSGEDMALLVDTLHDLRKFRSKNEFLRKASGLNIDFSGEVFCRLLDIPEIDIVEMPTKSGDLERVSLKATRKSDESVSVSELNSVLRELNRDLTHLQELTTGEFSQLLLKADILPETLEYCSQLTTSLKALGEKRGGYLFSPIKAKKIEDEFRKLFPNCLEGHPLRSVLPRVERELSFYGQTAAIEKKWKALGVNIFKLVRQSKLFHVLENLQEAGSLLWRIVYSGQRLSRSLEALGIEFGDARTLTQNDELR